MMQVPLGKTGLNVSRIAFGCGPSAGLMVDGFARDQDRAVGVALDAGITLFDTAAAYGAGMSESNLGRVLRDQQCAANVQVATKFVVGPSDCGDLSSTVLRSVEGSLRRLGLDRVDILQMHNRVAHSPEPGARVGIGPVLSTGQVLDQNGVADGLVKAQERGLVDVAGLTAYGGEPAAIKELVESGVFGMINGEFNLLNPTAIKVCNKPSGLADYGQVLSHAYLRGVGVAVIRALGGGSLIEHPGRLHPLAAKRARDPDHAAQVRLGRNMRVVLRRDDRPLQHIAIDFVLMHEEVSTLVLGFSSSDHVIDAVTAFNSAGQIPQRELDELDRAFSVQPE